MEPVSVLIVDDDHAFRESLRAVLESDGRIHVIGDAADAGQALELADALRPSVVLMDYEMPGMDGVTATTLLHEKLPETKVIMLTGNDEFGVMTAAFGAGAFRYIRKRDLGSLAGLALAVARV